MAALQQTSSVGCSARASRQSNLLAAKPLSQRLCFQASVRSAPAQAQRSTVTRAMPKVVAVAAAEPAVDTKLPAGYHWYETMMILKANLNEEDRDRELAKFEAYLNKEECFNINALVKGRSKLAYPIKKEQEGIYVLYTYCARRQTARAVQQLLSNPEAGAEDTILRHITLCKL